MYTRKSQLVKPEQVQQKHQQLIEAHCKEYALGNILLDNPLIINTISTYEKRKLFKKVTAIIHTTTFLTAGAVLNFIIDESGAEKIILVAIKNLHAVKEYKPVTIGKKTIEDSGFELQAVFNGLGWAESRTKLSSYFIPIEKGEIYDAAKGKLMLNEIQGT